jgi:hypothetical protein
MVYRRQLKKKNYSQTRNWLVRGHKLVASVEYVHAQDERIDISITIFPRAHDDQDVSTSNTFDLFSSEVTKMKRSTARL